MRLNWLKGDGWSRDRCALARGPCFRHGHVGISRFSRQMLEEEEEEEEETKKGFLVCRSSTISSRKRATRDPNEDSWQQDKPQNKRRRKFLYKMHTSVVHFQHNHTRGTLTQTQQGQQLQVRVGGWWCAYKTTKKKVWFVCHFCWVGVKWEGGRRGTTLPAEI